MPWNREVLLAAAGALGVTAMAVGMTAVTSGAGLSPLASLLSRPSDSAESAVAPGDLCGAYIAHLATDLGKPPAEVRQALAQARDQALDDLAGEGAVTRRQASQLEARGRGQPVCPTLPRPSAPAGSAAGPPQLGVGLYAQALGVSPQQLRQELAAGATVRQLAAARGLDEAAFRARLVQVLQSDLAPQVQAGRVSQQAEDRALQRARSGALPGFDQSTPGQSPSPSPAGV